MPGRRSSVTELEEQITPVHEHGVGWERFQRRDLPPTAERRERRAALSEARSGFPVEKKIQRRRRRR